jgi:hypothetical protein
MKIKQLKQIEDLLQKIARCWKGYKPVKGKKPYSQGSCEAMEEDMEEKIERKD